MECRDDPNRFNEVVLGRGSYWEKQRAACEAIVKYRTVLIRTGNGVGKSFWLGGIAPWWLHTRPGSLVIATAPSQTLLGTVLFKEIRRARANSLLPLGGKITDSPKASPQLYVLDQSGWQCLGIATRGLERLSGQHAAELLVIVDEASGVDEEIYQAIDSLNPQKYVLCGNPVRSEGYFRELGKQAAKQALDPSIPDHERIVEIVIPATDSPDAHIERSPRGLTDAGFLREMRRRYGEDSLWWRSHIRAIWPEVSSADLFFAEWLDRACSSKRPRVPQEVLSAGPTRIGCDLGEGVGRDHTAIIVRDDLGVLEIVAGCALGLAEAANEIARLMLKWDVQPYRITYDRLGIGKDMGNHLARHRITGAIGYQGNGTPDSHREFTNLRSEAAWRLRCKLNPHYAPRGTPPDYRQPPFCIAPGPWWVRLREELEALSYDLVGTQTRLIPKESLLDKLGRSPDLADALIQTFAFP